MAETTSISKLIINYLTEEQYRTARASGLINENELYITDVQDSTTLDCFEELFTATEGQTLFTLTEGTYVPNQSRLTICVNGAQQPSTAYTETSSSSFTFDSGLSAGDSVIARYVNARIVSNITDFPASVPPSTIAQDASNRFVTDTEKSTWNYSEFSSVATNQDDDGTYKAVEWKRVDNTVYARSTLIGTAPYSQVRVDYYDASGANIIKTITWDLTYDDNEFPYKREVDA
jgi:hypothetical protein